MLNYKIILSVIIANLLFFNQIFPATYNSVSSGNWNDLSIWQVGGVAASSLPGSNDDVIINHDVTVTNDISSGYAFCRTINVTTGNTLQLDPTFTNILWFVGSSVNKTVTIDGTVSGPGYFRSSRPRSFSGSGSINDVTLLANNYINNFDLDISVDSISLTVGSTMYINSGTLTINGGVRKSPTGKIINNSVVDINTNLFMTSGDPPSNGFQSSSGSIIISHPAAPLPEPQDQGYLNVTLNHDAVASFDFNISGNLVNNATFTATGNTITFNGAAPQTISGSGTNNFNNLTLNNPNGLTLSSGSINVTNVLTSTSGTITQNGANLTLESSSNNSAGLVKLNSSSDYSYLSGDFTVQRFYNGTSNGWRMVSAPIKSATLADWDDEFIYCGVVGGSAGNNFSYAGCGSFYSVYSYDESSANPTIDDGLSEVTSIGFGVSNATGTLIYTSSGVTTLSVTGTPEFDDISKSVTSNNAGWNLVANPYPSTIDWSAFTTLNTDITGNVWYVYSADAANYLSNSSNIPHSQGFWINSSSSTNLNFSVSETLASQETFYKSTNGINLPLKLKLTNNVNSYFDYAYLKTGPIYSNNFEPNADALKLFTPYPDYNANIYFLDNQGNSLDRSCINNNLSENVLFDVKIGQYAHGDYTIQFENLKQFMIGSCLQLEDLHNGIITDLRQDSIYTFTSDTNAPSPRFRLQITVDYDINVSNAMCFNDSSAFVSITGSNLQGHYFNLKDTSGLLIDSIIAVSDSITFNGLNAGVFQYETNHTGTCPTQNQLIYVTEPEQVISLFSTLSDTFYLDTSNQVSINFRNLSSGAAFYEWNLGDGNSSNHFSVNHTYTSPGTYSVKLISKMDSTGTCIDEYEKLIFIINPFSSIIDEFFSLINVFQKHNVLTIEYGNNIFDFCYLNDISGKRITNKIKRDEDSSIITASIPSIKPGIYFLSFELDNGSVFTRKVFLK